MPTCAFGTRSSFASNGDLAAETLAPSAERLRDEGFGGSPDLVQRRRMA